MTIELRTYQRQVVLETHEAIAAGYSRPLIVAGTGSGKTIVAAQLIADFASQGLRILFLVHLDVLVGQTASKLESFGIPHGFIKCGYPEDRSAQVQIASCQTLPRRDWWKEQHFDVIFYDECHKTAWTQIAAEIFKRYPNSIHIGLTATPWRLSKYEGMGDRFDSLIQAPLPRELMEVGYLVYPTYYSLPEADLAAVAVLGGDYREDDLAVACNKPELIDRAIDDWFRVAAGKRTIAFGVDVEHAKAIARGFSSAGVRSAVVDGSTPISERDRLYRMLATGELELLSSCGVLTEGFDVPAVECILMSRPTKSKCIYFQQLGRGLRPAPGKDRCIILDQAGNVRRFGFVEDLERFTLDRGTEKQVGKIPLKVCPPENEGCGAYVRTFAHECPHCGYEFPERIKAQQLGNLVALHTGQDPTQIKIAPLDTPNIRELDRLIHIQQQRGYQRGWIYHQFIKLQPNLAELTEFGKRMGYKSGWAFYKYKDLYA